MSKVDTIKMPSSLTLGPKSHSQKRGLELETVVFVTRGWHRPCSQEGSPQPGGCSVFLGVRGGTHSEQKG